MLSEVLGQGWGPVGTRGWAQEKSKDQESLWATFGAAVACRQRRDVEPGDLTLKPPLCSLTGQFTLLPCDSVSSSERITTVILHRVVVRMKRANSVKVPFHCSGSPPLPQKL